MPPARLRLCLLIFAAFVAAVVPSVAFAKSQAGAQTTKARSWSWSRSVSAAGRYDVVIALRRVPGRKAGVDVLDVTGPDRRTRRLDPVALNAGTARLTVAVPTRKVALRFVVRRGNPVVRSTGVQPAAATPQDASVPPTSAPARSGAASGPVVPATGLTAPATGGTASITPSASNPSVPSPAVSAPGRKLLFSDEFAGSAGALPAGSAWDPQEGAGWGTGQLQSYTARTQNVKLDGNGNLAIVARKETYTGADRQTVGYTSARLQTKGRFSFTYGRVEARIKVPSGAGLWPAFWTLGDDIYAKGWPESGEIDVMETIGSLPNELNGTVHAPLGAWSGSPDIDGTEWTRGEIYNNPSSLSDAFHVYAAEWKPTSIDFSIDGKVYFSINRSDMPGGGRWTFDHANHLLLNLAVGGEWPGAPNSATPFPSTMLVDWVHVYEKL